MALYIPHSIFHLAWLLYVRPETFGTYYICAWDCGSIVLISFALLLAHFGNLCVLVQYSAAVFININTKEIMFLNCAIVITRLGLKWQRIKDSSSSSSSSSNGKRRDSVMHLYFRIYMTYSV